MQTEEMPQADSVVQDQPPKSREEAAIVLPVIRTQHCPYEFAYLDKNGSTGLYWCEKKSKGRDGQEEVVDHFISTPVIVTAQVRDIESTGWGRLITFHDQDGNEVTYTVRFADISRDCDAILTALRDRGLFMTSSGNARKLVDFIHNAVVERKVRTTDLAGWHASKVFVLPGRTIGAPEEELIFSNVNLRLKPFHTKGTLEEWQNNVAKYCVGNNVLAFVASIAFAAPLLNIIHQENGGFNLMGESSIGKSTAMALATSIYGNPRDAIQKWNMTINSLEGVAKAYNDFMLPLDEIGQSPAHQIGEIVYMLGNGSGKGRANVHGEARRRAHFRTLFLSNGEKSLEEHMGEASRKIRAGQDVRLVDFPANCDQGMGIYQTIYGAESSRKFNDMLLNNSRFYFGCAFDAYIGRVIDNLEAIPEYVKGFSEKFIKDHVPAEASGQVMRIASRFALVAAAGTLATQFGITGWPETEANDAVAFCFNKWLAQRGTTQQSEETRLITQVQRFFEANGDARFSSLRHLVENKNVRDRVGFKEEIEGSMRYYVLPNQLDQIVAGFNKTAAIKTLVKDGYIIPDKNNKSQINKRLPGSTTPKKVYQFSCKVIAESEETEETGETTVTNHT